MRELEQFKKSFYYLCTFIIFGISFLYTENIQAQDVFVYSIYNKFAGVGTMKDLPAERGHWKVTKVGNSGYIQFQNRYSPKRYLHIQHGKLEASEIGAVTWGSSHWKRIKVGNTKFVQLQNKWKKDQYLHTETGVASAGKLGAPGWWSAQWELVDVPGGYVKIKCRTSRKVLEKVKEVVVKRTDNVKVGNFVLSKSKNKDKSAEGKVVSSESGNQICSEQTINAAESFDINFVVEDNSSTVVYPGAMIYGEDMLNGKYNTIYAERAPITISTDLPMIGEGEMPSRTVEDPHKKSNITNAINNMFNHQERGALHTSGGLEFKSVYTQEQLNIALGGRFSSAGADVDGSFNMSMNSEKNYLTATFLQKYFTIEVDRKGTGADFFKTPAEAKRVLNDKKTPLYISEVNYGRAAYFLLETSVNHLAAAATLNASYKAIVTEGETNMQSDFEKLMKKSTMKVLVVGSSAESTVKVVDGWEGFKQMIKEGAVLGQKEMPRPISYKMSFVEDGSVANVNLTTSYVKRVCRKATGTIVVKLLKMKNTSKDQVELYENVDLFLYKNGAYITSKSIKFADEANDVDLEPGEETAFTSNETEFSVKVGEEHLYEIKLESQIWDADGSDARLAGSKTIRCDKANIREDSFLAREGDRQISIYFSAHPVE